MGSTQVRQQVAAYRVGLTGRAGAFGRRDAKRPVNVTVRVWEVHDEPLPESPADDARN